MKLKDFVTCSKNKRNNQESLILKKRKLKSFGISKDNFLNSRIKIDDLLK
jgi:hypothetical protein